MYAIDFEYDNRLLSDFGFIVCQFNAPSDVDIVSAGSKITFNTTPYGGGKKFGLASTQYDECLEATFDICKNPDIYDDMEVTEEEYRSLIRWLNRKQFLKFKIVDGTSLENCCYYEVSFNVDKIKLHETLYGLELTATTNRPFGLGKKQKVLLNTTSNNQEHIVCDVSDEIGYTYPNMVITCTQQGDLTISNSMYDGDMQIKNCSVGEIITIDGGNHIISSSLNSHTLSRDFNFEFFKLANTYRDRKNVITVSIPCNITLEYNPIIKNSF